MNPLLNALFALGGSDSIDEINEKAEIVKEFQLGIKTQMVEKVTVDKDWFMNL